METVVNNETGQIVTTDDPVERHKRIVSLRNQSESTFLQLGKELYQFKNLGQWKPLGYRTFSIYLADPEVDIHPRLAQVLMQVYEKFILDLQFLEKPHPDAVSLRTAGYNKLSMLCPHVTPANAERWVERATVLSRPELKRELEEEFPPPPSPPLPEGKYQVLLADPPWQYDNSGFAQSAASHYQTMPTEEICMLPVEDLEADDCVLFLWVTNAFLHDGLDVMESWGFEYKTNFVWVKDKAPGIGWFCCTKHELLFIGTKGSNIHPKEKPDSIITGEVTRHSKKPESVYDMIERMYEGPYIELFARHQHNEKWRVWGNEV